MDKRDRLRDVLREAFYQIGVRDREKVEATSEQLADVIHEDDLREILLSDQPLTTLSPDVSCLTCMLSPICKIYGTFWGDILETGAFTGETFKPVLQAVAAACGFWCPDPDEVEMAQRIELIASLYKEETDDG